VTLAWIATPPPLMIAFILEDANRLTNVFKFVPMRLGSTRRIRAATTVLGYTSATGATLALVRKVGCWCGRRSGCSSGRWRGAERQIVTSRRRATGRSPGGGRGGLDLRRPAMACPSSLSAHSRSLPTGTPMAMRVTRTPSGDQLGQIDRGRFAFDGGVRGQDDLLTWPCPPASAGCGSSGRRARCLQRRQHAHQHVIRALEVRLRPRRRSADPRPRRSGLGRGRRRCSSCTDRCR
jgi:hypothetical protein